MEAENTKCKDEILIDFHAWATKPLKDRRRTNKFTLRVTNKYTLLAANIYPEGITC